MVSFVVVEDNKLHMNSTKEIIMNYMMKNSYDFDILEFSCVDSEFEKLVKSEKNLIYILDFELPDTNAIEISRLIRKYDWASPIIVFTVNGGMAYETFKQRLQILDFVSKQFEAEKNLFELFDICFKQLKIKKSFKYKVGKLDYNIDFNKILYVYKDTSERKSVIVTDKNEYPLPITLKEIKGMLSKSFAFSHKSCIVNIKRVDAFDWVNNKVIFDNGKEILFLSKTHKKELLGS